jgi:F0F1-type ATP synthase assembly protein I
VLLAIDFLAGLCCWLLFSWQVCVVGYCFPGNFMLLTIVFLAAVLLAIVFQQHKPARKTIANNTNLLGKQ